MTNSIDSLKVIDVQRTIYGWFSDFVYDQKMLGKSSHDLAPVYFVTKDGEQFFFKDFEHFKEVYNWLENSYHGMSKDIISLLDARLSFVGKEVECHYSNKKILLNNDYIQDCLSRLRSEYESRLLTEKEKFIDDGDFKNDPSSLERINKHYLNELKKSKEQKISFLLMRSSFHDLILENSIIVAFSLEDSLFDSLMSSADDWILHYTHLKDLECLIYEEFKTLELARNGDLNALGHKISNSLKQGRIKSASVRSKRAESANKKLIDFAERKLVDNPNYSALDLANIYLKTFKDNLYAKSTLEKKFQNAKSIALKNLLKK